MNAETICAGIQTGMDTETKTRYIQNPETEKIDCYVNGADGMGWILWERDLSIEEAINMATEEAEEWQPIREW